MTTTPIADFETIERGDFITPTNQKTKSLFKVIDKNHTPNGKVRLVLVNALTVNPKTSTVIPQNNRHWYPQRIVTYERVDPSQFPEWVSNKRQSQTNGRFDRIGWHYDWSLFDQKNHVIEPRLRSPFNFETYIVDPIKDAIGKIEKSMANKLEHQTGEVVQSTLQADWFIKDVLQLSSLRSELVVAQERLSILREKANGQKLSVKVT